MSSHRGAIWAELTAVGSVSFKWIDKNVQLFTQLPLFERMLDKQGKLIIDEATVEDLKQRAPHWDRQYALVTYLLRQPNRKFPPILVVISEPWVDKPKDDESWDQNGRALRTSMPFQALDKRNDVGLIDFRSGVVAFAIDGSHRTIAIKGAMDAIRDRQIHLKNKRGEITGKAIPLQDLLDDVVPPLTTLDVQEIGDETIGIEMIPAVMEGETRDEARIRVRSVFVHVNKAAAPPTAGEQVILDEDNGFSIVARRIGLSHPLFNQDNAGDRVNWNSTALPANSKWISPAIVLKEMVGDLLGDKDPYSKWGSKAR